MSQAGIIDAVVANPDIPITFICDSGSATAAANTIYVLGSSGITTSGSGDTITVSVSGGGFTWQTVAGTSQNMSVQNGYVPLNVGLTTFTLPATASVGEQVQVGGFGSGGWTIGQNAGQVIHFNSTDTTTGVGGSLASTNRYNAVQLICVATDTDWLVLDASGTLTVT